MKQLSNQSLSKHGDWIANLGPVTPCWSSDPKLMFLSVGSKLCNGNK